jgi:ABC-type Fe3+ transport system permease subunit
MGPLSLKLQRNFSFLLLSIFFFFVLAPLLYAITQVLLKSQATNLSTDFFLLLFHSFIFAFLLAAASTFFVAFGSLVMGHFYLQKKPHQPSLKLLELISFLTFSMSPTLMALSLLYFFNYLSPNLGLGLWAMILCHFLMNFSFCTFLFFSRINRLETVAGSDYSYFFFSLGANSLAKLKHLSLPFFMQDFKSWGPQLFIWSFTSFSPVILLADKISQSTPEVLLFYSLLNDDDGARFLCIFILNLLVAFGINKLFSTQSRHLELAGSQNILPSKNNSSLIFSLLTYLLCFILLLPFIFSFFQNLTQAQSAFFFSPELQAALKGSLWLLFYSFSLCALFILLLALCDKRIHLIYYFNFISAPMLLLAWLEGPWELGNSFALIAFGTLLLLLPWVARLIRSHVEKIPSDIGKLCLSLGMTRSSYFKHVLWPQIRSPLLKVSTLVALWSLGEYAFSKALLERSSTLVLFTEEHLRRYQFGLASTGMTLSLSLTFLVALLFLWKNKSCA